MKKNFLFFALIFFASPAFSQIALLNVPASVKTIYPTYDSLSNVVADKYSPWLNYLVGQKIYYIGSNKINSLYRKNGATKEIEYLSNDSTLRGKYFSVEDVTTNSLEYLLIREENTMNFYYLRPSFIPSDFVVVGFFEKMKNLYLGKEYVMIDNDLNFVDFKTREHNYCLPEKKIWKCVNVVVDPDLSKFYFDNRVGLVFENDSLGKYYYPLEFSMHSVAVNKNLVLGIFQPINEYYAEQKALEEQAVREATARKIEQAKNKAAMIKKYGKINGTKIAKGLIWVGMSKKMCIDSWGEPNDINRSLRKDGVSEQWVYGINDPSYIYFENGILTSIQD